jgi:hypothetical protein
MAKRPNAERQAWGQRRYRNGIEKVCFAPSVLKKSAMRMDQRDTRARARWCSSGLQSRRQDQLCQLPEVLGRGSQEELVSSTDWTSQPEPVEAQDALQVREQHFDLLTFTARPDVGIGLRDVARNISVLHGLNVGLCGQAFSGSTAASVRKHRSHSCWRGRAVLSRHSPESR